MAYSVKSLLVLVMFATIPFGGALACECGPYVTDDKLFLEELIQTEISFLHRRTAVIDGIFIEKVDGPDSVGIIRPTKIWFGPKQREFKIVQPHMCNDSFFIPNIHVQIALDLEEPEPGLLNRIKAFFGLLEPAYSSSCRHRFEYLMAHPAMQKGVRQEAERRRKEALKKR